MAPYNKQSRLSAVELLDLLVERLSDTGHTFWVDSGTLLGLVRDGGLIAGDNDLDLCLLGDPGSALDPVHELLRALGYKKTLRRYRGVVCKYKYLPPHDNRALPEVDLGVFQKGERVYWCPQWIHRGSRHDGVLYYVFGLPRKILKIAFERSAATELTARTWKPITRIWTWCVPKPFLETPAVIHDTYPVPSPVEDYLSLRYGAWRVPDPNWTIRNDGALKQVAPEECEQEYA